ncbi:MAG: rRNA pseudouridine synthase [Ruminococcus sp.]|nr:rRNA pseudouridine synthase [Ruminococcus sp.]
MERLDKILVSQNICTRKEASRLVRQGLVTVDGETAARSDIKVDPENSIIKVRGQAVDFKKHIYLMMNKPAGVVSATEDNFDRTVIDLVPERFRRAGLFPAGRLDKDTVGLLILTDDGDFAHKILSPSRKVFKKYYAELDSPPDESTVESFERGITFKDGTTCLPARLELLGGARVNVYICEGKFHQVKKMFRSQGFTVKYLKRVAIGSLELDKKLHEGECRELSKYEKSVIFISK